MKVALIGYGDWAQKLRKWIDISNTLELVKIFSRRPIDDKAFTIDMNEILQDELIEALIIATSPETHYSFALMALTHGKHVFCEKPLVHSNQDLENLFQIAKKNGLKLYTNYTYLESDAIKYFIMKVKSFSKSKTDLEMNLSQFGKFYKEEVYWTLLPHHISVLDELIDLNQVKFEIIEKERLFGNFITASVIKFSSPKLSGHLTASLQSKEKIRMFKAHSKEKIIAYNPLDLTDIIKDNSMDPSDKTTIINFKTKEQYNILKSLNNFQSIVTMNLEDNINKSTRITSIIEKILRL